ncbi:MAG: MFS superfamily sulfate permease-like transporter [Psychroserpens sp.]|jgi:MFS superfamily sulfate permease-like transporter
MNDFFEQIFYQNEWLYDAKFTTILGKAGFFTTLGLLMFIIPLVVLALFYFLNKYPYGKWWHWIITWLVAGFIVGVISRNLLNYELAEYVLSGDKKVSGFISNLSIANFIYSLAVGFIISFVYKQVPGPQSTLPFCIKKK